MLNKKKDIISIIMGDNKELSEEEITTLLLDEIINEK